jgi:hypothetical protein
LVASSPWFLAARRAKGLEKGYSGCAGETMSIMSLRALPLTLRALFSSFLLLIGIGYLMALSYLFLVDVEPHQQMGMGLGSELINSSGLTIRS